MAQTLHRIFLHVVFSTKDQAAHHERVAFKAEFVSLLKRHEPEYEERFLWR